MTEFLILPGHHLYKMDYQRLIMEHWKNNVDITIVVSNAAKDRNHSFGTLTVNHDDHRVVNFNSKSESSDDGGVVGESTFACMGIFLIKRDVMSKLLKEKFPNENAFGEEVIQGAISLGMKVRF